MREKSAALRPNLATKALWLRWTLLCAAGEIIGIGVAAGTVALLLATLGEPTTIARRVVIIAVAVAAGAIEGLAVGHFQWLGLRQQIPAVPKRAWVTASIAVAALGWFLGMTPSVFFFGQESDGDSSGPPTAIAILLAIPLGLMMGALFGGGQWYVLRRYALHARRWILGNALGWSLAFIWIFLAATLIPEGMSVALIALAGVGAGLFSGLSVGSVTGAVLLQLRPKS